MKYIFLRLGHWELEPNRQGGGCVRLEEGWQQESFLHSSCFLWKVHFCLIQLGIQPMETQAAGNSLRSQTVLSVLNRA